MLVPLGGRQESFLNNFDRVYTQIDVETPSLPLGEGDAPPSNHSFGISLCSMAFPKLANQLTDHTSDHWDSVTAEGIETNIPRDTPWVYLPTTFTYRITQVCR